MGDYTPFYVSLLILFGVGLLVPFIAEDLNLIQAQQDSILQPLVDLVAEGVSIFGLSFNVFGLLGSTIQNYLLSMIIAFTYLPNWLSFVFITFIMFGFAYVLIKLLPTT